MEIPSLPVPLADFIPYINKHADNSFVEILKPFKAYEARLREVFAQEPDHRILADQHINTLPIFAGNEKNVRIRARDLEKESKEETERYLLSLPREERKAHGSPAIVESLKEFRTNFNLFSESSLVDMDWSNVVAAGSSVVTALLPVKHSYGESKRALREYYHEKLAPASDVDLFLFGLTEKQAIEKIKLIETKIRDSILSETTTIRTKNAITIASQYPTRHVQIVLRLYKSISEILTGFDVDCSCVAFDGSQVWATPRAIVAYMSQVNSIDLTPRSPSYENRLSKYSHRGFEAYWPALERSRVDPTIFERSFSRVLGLARLLVLEKLPMPTDRDNYLAQRRVERGRPPLNWNARNRHQLRGNVKDTQPDDVAEWVEEDEVSNYHTFTIPYGKFFSAKKIEKLLFTKDLLLNAEWNKARAREVNLHRHPAFFGSVNDVIHDCCGFCPAPTTDEELEVAEQEDKIYIKGDISFMKDDPGRQAIGSFHPITDDDWTEMAYVGNTERLCQAIVDADLEHVQDWCEQEGADVNRRDHTGRTPLHLATMCSTLEIVRYLVDHGARIVARLVDGFTAFHLAARRGDAGMVKCLLEKSEENAEAEEEKAEHRRDARKAEGTREIVRSGVNVVDEAENEEDDEEDLVSDDSESVESHTVTEGSFVKIRGANSNNGDTIPAEDEDEPDIYDIDVLAWDSPVSPLHLSIMGGHLEVIELLVETFGADVLLPVKLVNEYNRSPRAALLTLTLALGLPVPEATKVSEKLLRLGASSAQADMNQITALHYIVFAEATDVLQTLFSTDEPAAKIALNHLSIDGWVWQPNPISPLLTAIRSGKMKIVDMLLAYGAEASIGFEPFVQSMKRKFDKKIPQDPAENLKIFKESIEQPVIVGAQNNLPRLVRQLLDHGVDPNTLTKSSHALLERPQDTWRGPGSSLLDIVNARLKSLRTWTGERKVEQPKQLQSDEFYLAGLDKGTYKHWLAKGDLEHAKEVCKRLRKDYEKEMEAAKPKEDTLLKKRAVEQLIIEFETLNKHIQSKGGKSFDEIHPRVKTEAEKKEWSYKHANFTQPQTAEVKPYETEFQFMVPDLTPSRKDGYFQLFQAAWEGDVQTVKAITLAPWGEHELAPLPVAIKDARGFSPFAIAIYRGHLALAKTILEIAVAQYEPDREGRRRYELVKPESEDDMDSDNEIKVHGELVDEDFTVDNIGTLVDSVRSKVSPQTLLGWDSQIWRFVNKRSAVAKNELGQGQWHGFSRWHSGATNGWSHFKQIFDEESHHGQGSLFRYAVYVGDASLVRFLLNLGMGLVERKQEDVNASRIFSLPASDYDLAVSLGRTDILGEIIKKTGAGMPLDSLVQRSGIKLDQRPKYYQGLSVHGEKRQDWADQGRGVVARPVESQRPPLLKAAFEGNLESTEFFLGDGPLRKYKEFATTYEGDARLKVLARGEGGIQLALESWLGARNNLALHCAVMARPTKTSNTEQVEMVLKSLPGALNSTNVQGFTPMLLALSLRRISICRVLLEAGANVLVRDSLGRNAMHHILTPDNGPAIQDVRILGQLMEFVDKEAVQPMLLERCGCEPGATTPLSLWLRQGGWSREILETLLSYSEGADLAIMNGAGDYPLHQAVSSSNAELVKTMIDFNPSLLHRENAVGLTPLELVNNSRLRGQLDNVPSLSHVRHHTSVEDRDPSEFKEKLQEKRLEVSEVCKEAAISRSAKRKLISLFDANEVARRLALKQKQDSCVPTNMRSDPDEVQEWMTTAASFQNHDVEPVKKKAMTSRSSSSENELR